MDENYKSTSLYKWSRRCFWILLIFYLPTYVVTRYLNEDEYYNPTYRFLTAIIPVPAHRVKWEAYIMTSDQITAYLEKGISPKTIVKEKSISSIDQNGDYYILFRLNANDHHVDGGWIKCYVGGVKYPIEFEAYSGRNSQFKDYFVPVQVDPKKFKSHPPRIKVRWRCIWRY